MYINNGTITVNHRPQTFSFRRFLLTITVCAIFWITNPANNNTRLWNELEKINILLPIATRNEFLGGNKYRTNFAFFSVRERRTSLDFFILGQKCTCKIDDNVMGRICKALKLHVTHQQPLLWDPNDQVYSAHRILVWTMFFLLLISLSCRNPTKIYLQWLLLPFSFLMPSTNAPIESFLEAVVEMWFFVYPAWLEMSDLVRMQSKKSLFRMCGRDDSCNFWFSFVCLLSFASLINMLVLTQYRIHLGYQTVVATALGYIRGATDGVFFQITDQFSLDPIAVTWVLLLRALVGRRSLATMTAWFVANAVGFSMGRYQYEHIHIFVMARSFWNGLEQMLGSFFGF